MASVTPPKSNVLLVLFPGFNTLDMNGPYEVLQRSANAGVFTVTVASETEITTSVEGVHVKRDVALDDALVARLSDYDLLVVPGGPGVKVAAQTERADSPLFTAIARFAELEPTDGQPPRILLSICTGAIFLGTVGVFNGKLCTTHWASYNVLVDHVKMAAARTACQQPGTVVASRFVDAGPNEKGVRIISSGGVSCGMDAALHVVKLRLGEETAKATADNLDYAWRKTEGLVFLDQ